MQAPTLDDIISHKRLEIEALKARLKRMGSTTVMRTIANVRSLESILSDPGLAVIPELKPADPWRGEFRETYDTEKLAQALEGVGAPALAVQTDARFFGGSYDDLFRAARNTALPVVARDFIIDEAQLTQAKANGADAAVISAQLVDDARLAALIEFAQLIMLEPIVEVLELADLDRALATDIKTIGVLARDIRSETIRLDLAPAMRERIPDDRLAIAIGGVMTARDLGFVRDAGFHGVFVGEPLMRAKDPAVAYSEMLDEAGLSA